MAYTRHEWIPNEIITTQKMNNLESLRDVISTYSPNITFAENWNIGAGYYVDDNNRLMTGTRDNPVASVWGENETWVMDDPRNLCIYNNYTSTFLPCGQGDTIRFYAGQASGGQHYKTFGIVNKQGEVIAKASHNNIRSQYIGGEFCITAPSGSAYVFINVHTDQVNINKAFLSVEKDSPGYYKYQNSDEIYYYDIAKHNNRTYVQNGLTINWKDYRLTINGTHTENINTHIYLAHYLTCDYNDQARLLLLQPGHIYEARMRKISGSQTNANLELNFSIFRQNVSAAALDDGSNFPRDTHKTSSGDNQYTRIRYLSQYSQGITPLLHIWKNSTEPAVFDNYCVEIKLFDITSRYMIAPVEHMPCALEPHNIGDIIWIYDHELNYDGLYSVINSNIVQNEPINTAWVHPLRLVKPHSQNIVGLIKNIGDNTDTAFESIDQSINYYAENIANNTENISNNTTEINKRLLDMWEVKYNKYFATNSIDSGGQKDPFITIRGNYFKAHPTTTVNKTTICVISGHFNRDNSSQISGYEPSEDELIPTSIFNDGIIHLEIYRTQFSVYDATRLIGIVCIFYKSDGTRVEDGAYVRFRAVETANTYHGQNNYLPREYDKSEIEIPQNAEYVLIGLTDTKHNTSDINEGYIKIY